MGVILSHEAIELLFALERVVSGPVRFASQRALYLVAAIRETFIVALEQRGTLFDRGDLIIEVLNHRATVILSRVKKDASQGRRNKVVVFLWDDRQVGCH